MKPDGSVFRIGGHIAADFRGEAISGGSIRTYYWIRLLIAKGSVWIIRGTTNRKNDLELDSDLAYVIGSVFPKPGT